MTEDSKMRLYLDESGECSFSESSAYKHFLLTILSISSNDLSLLNKRLKRQHAKLIDNGWDKKTEPKASVIYKHKAFGGDWIRRFIQSLSNVPSLGISYIIVNKSKIENESFRNSPYGTGYNYFCKLLLSELIFKEGYNDIYLIFDKRNKETHSNRHFKEYIQTEIRGMALENKQEIDLSMEGLESQNCKGLLAVDYYSWAIYRNFEYKDSTFFRMFEKSIVKKIEWYID